MSKTISDVIPTYNSKDNTHLNLMLKILALLIHSTKDLYMRQMTLLFFWVPLFKIQLN